MTTTGAQPYELENPNTYSTPKEFCDVVMKGGLTSGVVYPLAICELARHYSFKNIGGTSAGAIGAAAAAAAEYHRRTNKEQKDDSGFARLAKLPKWLGGEGNVAHLFQPNPLTAPIFRVLTSCLGLSGGLIKKASVVLFSVLRNFPGWTLLGVLAGLLLVSPILFIIGRVWTYGDQSAQTTLLLLGWVVLLALTTCLVLATAFALIGVVRKVRSIPDNFYGLTTGLIDPEGKETHKPLTPWLADTLDKIAGKPAGSPLTFGDLREAYTDMDQKLREDDPDAPAINLQMMTTNVTLGRPYRFPFDDDNSEYYYRPDEWQQFFPASIMKFLRESRSKLTPDSDVLIHEGKVYEPLPKPNVLPVVIAVRMSLSFPFLISPVPLWTIDRSMTKTVKPERCLFSDGGIASNFPLHFFDRTLPRWPTFAFNLKAFHREHPRQTDECENSYLVKTMGAGRSDNWDRFQDSPTNFGKLSGFVGALINTVYNWADNAQARVPGYRDRVVHIFEADDEGGMNLNMPSSTVKKLSERGRCAGVKLRERFTGNDKSELTWDHHRWVRYRSMMALMERALQSFKRAYDWPQQPSYKDLVTRGDEEPPISFVWKRKAHRDYAEKLTAQLAQLANDWQNEQQTTKQTFSEGEPRPVPELRIRPRI